MPVVEAHRLQGEETQETARLTSALRPDGTALDGLRVIDRVAVTGGTIVRRDVGNARADMRVQ